MFQAVHTQISNWVFLIDQARYPALCARKSEATQYDATPIRKAERAMKAIAINGLAMSTSGRVACSRTATIVFRAGRQRPCTFFVHDILERAGEFLEEPTSMDVPINTG